MMHKQPTKPVCAACGSDDVLGDAYVAWNVDGQAWEVSAVFDNGAVCNACDGECSLKWIEAGEED